jgi:hypothetical protein
MRPMFLGLCFPLLGCAGVLPPPQEAPPAAVPSTSVPVPGTPCTNGECSSGLTCVSYYGIAGAAGPPFSSCEIPCPHGPCPEGLGCVTIADGPGAVCR